MQGFKIPFSQTPFQYGPPQLAKVNQEKRLQLNSEIKEMLRKGAIQQVKSEPGEVNKYYTKRVEVIDL